MASLTGSSTTDIRRHFNNLFGERMHYQIGIAKYWNTSFGKAMSKFRNQYVLSNDFKSKLSYIASSGVKYHEVTNCISWIPFDDNLGVSAARTFYGIAPVNSLTGNFTFVNNDYLSLDGQSWMKYRGEADNLYKIPYVNSKEGFTYSLWIRRHSDSSATNQYHFISINSYGDYVMLKWSNVGGSILRSDVYCNGVAKTLLSSVNSSDWQHVSVSYKPSDASGIKMYVNGNLVATQSSVGMERTTHSPTWNNFWFGVYGTSNVDTLYCGKFDIMNFLWYNKILTEAEIEDIANSKRPVDRSSSLITVAGA